MGKPLDALTIAFLSLALFFQDLGDGRLWLAGLMLAVVVTGFIQFAVRISRR